MKKRDFIKSFLPHPMLMLTLVLMWLLLQNSFSVGGLVMGLILGISIPLLTKNFWPQRPAIKSYSKAVAYFFIVAWDILIANIAVAKLIIFVPVKSLRSCWVVIPLELESAEAKTVLAGTITLTPGTVSADFSADGRSLLVHCLDVPDIKMAVEEMKGRYEARLKEIFS